MNKNQKFYKRIQHFINNPYLSDTEFIINEKKIYIHRIILSMYSTFFKNLFLGMI